MVVREHNTEAMRNIYTKDSGISAWWGTRVECISALARLTREGMLGAAEANAARSALHVMFGGVEEVPPTEDVRVAAERLLNRYPLRAADALQLAAALAWAGGRPLGHELVSLDARLREAALTEGFSVLPAV